MYNDITAGNFVQSGIGRGGYLCVAERGDVIVDTAHYAFTFHIYSWLSTMQIQCNSMQSKIHLRGVAVISNL